ncbi:MAG: YceI family protein [Thermaerobacter sp.]|nr:YceI family protein [Thermaerobacter sp.]
MIDTSHTSANFSVRHMAITTVRGQFEKISGKVEVDGGKLMGAEVDIDVSSVNTHEENRDNHLKSADFFDVENHPHMHFSMTNAEQVRGDDYRLTGNLTIRGITKPVTLNATISEPFTDPWGNERLGVTLEGKVDRNEWNLKWNQVLEAGRLLVGNDVKIEVDAQAFHPKG